MKTMTCNQLGGACDMKFHGETFEKMAEQSKEHGRKMGEERDEAHLAAMQKMGEMMSDPDPEAMDKWYQARKDEFAALPENEIS